MIHVYVSIVSIAMCACDCVKIFWWDIRKISEPTEVMYLDPTKKQDVTKAHSAISLEYEPTIVSSVQCRSFISVFFINLSFTVIVK